MCSQDVLVGSARRAYIRCRPGSPTIRVDGEDLFPVPERAGYALGCRMYATPEGLRGSPTTEMLREALAKMEGTGAKGGL